MSKKYAVVTAISTFRMRYVIPVEDLQALNPNVESLDDKTALEWAQDSVTCEEVVDFSQVHLGEQIVDTHILTEEEILELFDKDNDYLRDWDREKKLKTIHTWKDPWTEKQKKKKQESEAQ